MRGNSVGADYRSDSAAGNTVEIGVVNMSNRRFLLSMVLALVWVLLIVMVVHSFTRPQVVQWDYHAVDVGDTLWNIAEEHNPGYTGDIRVITYQMKKANGMKNDTVYVGDLIMVPVVEKVSETND